MCSFVLALKLGERSAIDAPKTKSTLPFAELWDDDAEEEVVSLLRMGAREPTIIEDPSSMMEDILVISTGGPLNKHSLPRSC